MPRPGDVVSLGNKLIVFLTLPLLVIMILFGVLVQVRSRELLHREIAREGRVVVRVAQEAMEDYLRDRQIDDLRDLGDQLTGFERIVGLQIYDPDGRLVYHSRTLEPEAVPPAGNLQLALTQGKESESQRLLNGMRVISFVRPLFDPSGKRIVGVMEILEAESFIEEATRAYRGWIAGVTLIMMAATAFVVIVVARAGIGRPAADLVARFRAVGAGDLSRRAPAGRGDEFGELAREFEGMVTQLEQARLSLVAEQEERRRVEARLRHAERLASVGRLAAGLAHEIGTPLNVIGGRAEALQRRLAGEPAAGRSLGIISAQIDRISRIVRDLLDFARGSPPRLAPTAIPDVVGKVLDLLEQRLESAGVKVAVEWPANLPEIRADAQQLHQVFLNLVSNAIDVMPDGGTLTIHATRAAALPGSDPAELAEDNGGTPAAFVAVIVADTGPGIPPEHQGRVFDPFFTTKDVGRGTGLGLSVSYGIVRDHGGGIDLHSDPGAGSRFTVVLPIDGPGPETGAPAGRAEQETFA
jgi:signal transduction histidine kinase